MKHKNFEFNILIGNNQWRSRSLAHSVVYRVCQGSWPWQSEKRMPANTNACQQKQTPASIWAWALNFWWWIINLSGLDKAKEEKTISTLIPLFMKATNPGTPSNNTVYFFNLELGNEIIIFESSLTSYRASDVFRGHWGSIKNWLDLKIEPP